MTCQCKSCDKIIKHEIKDQQFESNCHEFYDQFTITRYIVQIPNNIILSEKMKNYVDIQKRILVFFSTYLCEESR